MIPASGVVAGLDNTIVKLCDPESCTAVVAACQ